jgi:hypothetical protein
VEEERRARGRQGPVDLKYLAQFRERLRGDPALEVEEIDNASAAELIAIVSHLPRETIVLPIQYVRDRVGNSYLSRHVFSQIAAASTALTMRFQTLIWERARLVDTLSTWRRPGKSRADAAAQILRGKVPADVALESSGMQ